MLIIKVKCGQVYTTYLWYSCPNNGKAEEWSKKLCRSDVKKLSCVFFTDISGKEKLRCRIGCERCETQLLIQCGHFTSAYTGKVSQVQINIFSLALCLASWGFPGGSVVKNSPASKGDVGSIPGPGRSLGEGNGNPLQYSYLENPMDRGAWRATVHRVTKSRTRWSTQHHTFFKEFFFPVFILLNKS